MIGDAFLPGWMTMTRNRIVEENKLPGAPSTEWDVNGWGDPSIQGFGPRHQHRPRRNHLLQDQDGLHALPDRHLPHGLVRRTRGAPRRHRRAVGAAPPVPARGPARSRDAPLRLRELGGVRVLDGAEGRSLRDLLRASRSPGSGAGAGPLARRPFAHPTRCPPRGGRARLRFPRPRAASHRAARTAREPHLLRRARRRGALRHPVPDRRHHLAGLQPLRRTLHLRPPRS